MFLNPQHGKFTPQQPITPGNGFTIPNIMKAILLSAGPVSNLNSLRGAGPRYMRNLVTKAQYNEAAHRLQEANLGQYITVVIGNSMPREIFIKRTPVEVEEIMTRNNELCIVPTEYAKRFNKAVPRRIRTSMRQRLVELGYVTTEQMFKD